MYGTYGMYGVCGMHGMYGMHGMLCMYDMHCMYGLHGMYGMYVMYGMHGMYGMYGMYGMCGMYGNQIPKYARIYVYVCMCISYMPYVCRSLLRQYSKLVRQEHFVQIRGKWGQLKKLIPRSYHLLHYD